MATGMCKINFIKLNKSDNFSISNDIGWQLFCLVQWFTTETGRGRFGTLNYFRKLKRIMSEVNIFNSKIFFTQLSVFRKKKFLLVRGIVKQV